MTVISDWLGSSCYHRLNRTLNPCWISCLLKMIDFISSVQYTYRKLRWTTIITLWDTFCFISQLVGIIKWIKAVIVISSWYRGHGNQSGVLWPLFSAFEERQTEFTSVVISQLEWWICYCISQQVSWSLDLRSHFKPLPHTLQLSSAHPALPPSTQQIQKQTDPHQRQAFRNSLW